MEELLSYRLSDLVLFSEPTLLRQFQLYTLWLGPFRYLGPLYAALFLLAWRGQSRLAVRSLVGTTALFWLICSYGFLHQYYVQINWAVRYFIPVLLAQAAFLAWASFRASEQPPSHAALIMWVLAILQPLFELATGQPVSALSAYALTPDSLSVYSLALMFLLQQSAWLYTPALLWLGFSSLVYLALGSAMAWYPLTALLLTIILLLSSGRRTISDKQAS